MLRRMRRVHGVLSEQALQRLLRRYQFRPHELRGLRRGVSDRIWMQRRYLHVPGSFGLVQRRFLRQHEFRFKQLRRLRLRLRTGAAVQRGAMHLPHRSDQLQRLFRYGLRELLRRHNERFLQLRRLRNHL
jgi:hypothetical protein